MDESLHFRQELLARYRRAVEEHAHYKRLVEQYRAKASTAGQTADIYREAIRLEGIDPDNPQPSLIEGAEAAETTSEEAEATETTNVSGVTDAEPAASAEQGESVNKTHAVFLAMNQNGHSFLNTDEVQSYAQQLGYELTKDDIWRVIPKQVKRGLILNEHRKYQLTARGREFAQKVAEGSASQRIRI